MGFVARTLEFLFRWRPFTSLFIYFDCGELSLFFLHLKNFVCLYLNLFSDLKFIEIKQILCQIRLVHHECHKSCKFCVIRTSLFMFILNDFVNVASYATFTSLMLLNLYILQTNSSIMFWTSSLLQFSILHSVEKTFM